MSPRTRSVPVAPGALPGVGHAWALLRSPLDFVGSLPEHGDLVEVRLGPFRTYVPCHPELLWQVLTDDRTFDKDGALYVKVRAVAGNALPLCARRDHRRQRRLIQPAFHRDRIEQFSTVMVDEITALTSRWSDGQVVDIFSDLFDMAVRTVCRTLFSTSPTPAAAREFRRALAVGLRGFLPGFLLPPRLERLPLPLIRHPRLMRGLLDARDLLLAAPRRPEDAGDDLIATLTSTGPDGCRAMTAQEIHEQIVPMISAGADTATSALSWARYLLAQHPEAERRLHAEVDTELGHGPARWGDLDRLPYTTRVLTETLRLYPPAWVMPRVTTAPARLGRADLPVGASVLFCSAAVHRHPDVYAHPHTFDPDRWLPHRARALPRGAFVPFGAGPRKCIGDHYGTVEATLALATIARRWQLGVHPRADPRPAALGTVLTPRRLLMRVHARGGVNAHRNVPTRPTRDIG
ncbi:cytochrome P450 [Streptomyces sp. NPDC049837]|uniref:cytochrome P450 n=1 Tax=Streptomyces sp. NPDC049837 TaxID=3155277 RepID=UPI00341C44E3